MITAPGGLPLAGDALDLLRRPLEILTTLTAVLRRWRLDQVGEAVPVCDTTYRLKESIMRVERR